VTDLGAFPLRRSIMFIASMAGGNSQIRKEKALSDLIAKSYEM